MFHNHYRLGVGLTTLFVFGLALPSAFGQVFVLPTAGEGWYDMAAALDPETDDIMVVGEGIDNWGEFVASSVSYSGTLNKTFGGGLVATDVTGITAANWPNACAVDSDGKLLAGGMYQYKTGQGFGLVRYNTNGSLDKTFNKSGIVTTNFKFLAEIYAMALQSNGNIVVAGGYGANNSPLVLARYLTTGALDSTFGSKGTVSTTLPVQSARVYAVALQSDGSIVVGAQFYPASGPRSMALIRYTSAGKLDTSFGINGIATISLAGQSSYLNDIVVINSGTDNGDPSLDDSIIVAGECDGDLAIVRFTADGALDTTFGTGGSITESFGTAAYSVALQGDGKIVMSGVASNGNLLVARFDQDGALDTAFGSTGGVFNGQGYADDFAYSPQYVQHSVLIQSTGQIALVAWDDTENVVVRYNSNGVPDKSFYARIIIRALDATLRRDMLIEMGRDLVGLRHRPGIKTASNGRRGMQNGPFCRHHLG